MTYDISERTFEFSKSVVLFIDNCLFKRLSYPILDQLLRSATSVGANIVEARSGNSRKNLLNFFSVALRSSNETIYWLRIVKDTMIVNFDEIDLLIKESNEISKILAKSILTLKRNETKK